jgi:ApaG protein
MSDPASAYEASTRDILVRVRAYFLDDQSEPENGRYVWAYRVAVENRGAETVQLVRRTWRITDAKGHTEQVQGEGVVGEKPVLAPGQAFEYTSGTPLPTPSGFMTGTYHMVVQPGGEMFDVAIPSFSLDSPHADGRVH